MGNLKNLRIKLTVTFEGQIFWVVHGLSNNIDLERSLQVG